MTISLKLPEKQSLKPTITVFGVGGGGGNAVKNMIDTNLSGVRFVIANTDAQAIEESPCDDNIQLGETITQGLGAGSYPEVGKAAAEEAVDQIVDYLQGSNMVFITAGLGGGTGTGASPVVARLAREQGILTVAVVTKPFHFEGAHRMRVAELGLQELAKYVDTLIVIPNQNLFRIADKNTTFLDAFKMADQVLHAGVRGITDLMVMPGMINLDFADVRAVMSEMGKAMMGTGEGEGENRALMAAEAAIANPLLDNVSMKGARGVLINITGGPDMTLFEVDEAANRIREEVDPDANIIFGSTFDQTLDNKIRVSVVATGIDMGWDADKEEERAPARKESSQSATYVQKSPVAKPKPQSRQEEAREDRYASNQKSQEFSYQQREMEDEADEGVFIAPEPEQPRDSFDFSQNNLKPNTVRNREAAAQASLEPVSKPHSGFLGGIFGSKRDHEDQQQPSHEQAMSSRQSALGERQASPKPAEPEKELVLEDDLDVPAFLRRKSN